MPSPDKLPNESSLKRGYETRDVNVGALVGMGFALAVAIALSLGSVRYLLDVFHKVATPQTRPLPLERTDQTPPSPRLQDKPTRDFAEYRDAQEQLLNSYGWVDKEAGTVHLPIARAMDLALERGLPKPHPATEKAGEESKP